MDGPTPETLDQSLPAWYLSLIAPSTQGPPYSWVEPTRLYMFSEVRKFFLAVPSTILRQISSLNIALASLVKAKRNGGEKR